MRRRTMASLLGVHASAGVPRCPIRWTCAMPVGTQTPNLYSLDTEPNIPNPADIISSKRFHRLVGPPEQTYDYVIYDMPPGGHVRRSPPSCPRWWTARSWWSSPARSGSAPSWCGRLRAAAEGRRQRAVSARRSRGTGRSTTTPTYQRDGDRVDPDKTERKWPSGRQKQAPAPAPARRACRSTAAAARAGHAADARRPRVWKALKRMRICTAISCRSG